MSRALVSEATTNPPGSLPTARGRRPWGSRAAKTDRSSAITKQKAPSSSGRTRIAAPSRSWWAISFASIVATRSESVVAADERPSRATRSAVFTRFPLWPRASARTPSFLKTGCALSQVVEPVVE
jgi:hypothetical protein